MRRAGGITPVVVEDVYPSWGKALVGVAPPREVRIHSNRPLQVGRLSSRYDSRVSDDVRPSPRVLPGNITWWAGTLSAQAIIVAFGLLEFVEGYPTFRPLDASGAISGAIILGAVLLRTRAPWVFLAIAVGLNFFYTLETPYRPAGWGVLVALPIAVYAVCSTVTFYRALAAVIASELILVLTALIARGVTFPNVFPVTVTAFLISSLALGQMTYAYRELIEATRRRAQAAEETKEAHAARRLAEHRLATARDLHDVVGHQIAVINIQAGAAATAVFDAPGEAVRSLSIIQSSAERVLAEIGELLKQLRSDQADPGEVPAGLNNVRRLSRTLGAGGLPIDLRIQRNLPDLPRNVDDALYRILEEALVNAYKHGSLGKPATASVGWDGRDLLVDVSNPVDALAERSRRGSIGYGLVGIRERAQKLGGSAYTELQDGCFHLHIEIPVASA